MTPEQRTKIIQALLQKDLQSIKEARGEIVVIRSFFDHLRFSQTIGRKLEDFDKIFFEEGPYKEALKRHNTDPEGELSPFPIWWVPADILTDEEIQAYKDG